MSIYIVISTLVALIITATIIIIANKQRKDRDMMVNKFENVIRFELYEYCHHFKSILDFTTDMGRIIDDSKIDNPLIVSTKDFAQVSIEYSAATFSLLKQGYLAESYAIIRCHLELSHYFTIYLITQKFLKHGTNPMILNLCLRIEKF